MKRKTIFKIGDRVRDARPSAQHRRTGTIWKVSESGRHGKRWIVLGVHWDGCETYPGYNRCHQRPGNLELINEAET